MGAGGGAEGETEPGVAGGAVAGVSRSAEHGPHPAIPARMAKVQTMPNRGLCLASMPSLYPRPPSARASVSSAMGLRAA